jgi:hypothetical protein
MTKTSVGYKLYCDMVDESQNSGKKEAALAVQLCNTHISVAMNKPHV